MTEITVEEEKEVQCYKHDDDKCRHRCSTLLISTEVKYDGLSSWLGTLFKLTVLSWTILTHTQAQLLLRGSVVAGCHLDLTWAMNYFSMRHIHKGDVQFSWNLNFPAAIVLFFHFSKGGQGQFWTYLWTTLAGRGPNGCWYTFSPIFNKPT